MMPKFKSCRVVRREVQPCKFLSSALEPLGAPFGQRLKMTTLIDRKSHKFSRSMVVLHSGDHRKTGVVVNNCPFCAADISAHVREPKEPNTND